MLLNSARNRRLRESSALAAALLIQTMFALGATASEIDLSEVNDDTPLTVGLYSQIAEATLPSIVSIRIYAQLSDERRKEFEKYRDMWDNPGDYLDDPDFPQFMQRFLDPNFRDLHKFFDNPDDMATSSGAGVIFDADGHIVTNSHVIGRGVDRGDLEVTLFDGRIFRGADVEVVAVSPLVDVAVLKINATDLIPARFGDSDLTRIGEPVLALGHPLELKNSVSEGIISAKGRRMEGSTILLENNFQTTAMINPGNSGGALVNMRGELIGINMAIATTDRRWQGIGFAIPSRTVYEVAQNLITSGREGFGWLGVHLVGVNLNTSPPRDERLQFLRWHGLREGVVVEKAIKGDPAERAGILKDDIIVSVDGRTIADNDELVESVASRPIEDKVEIEVLRVVESGELETMKFDVVLSERPSETELKEIVRERGKRNKLLIPVEEEVAEDTSERFGLKITAADGGLEIQAINPRSLAEKEDLRAGDLITKVNSKDVRTEEEFDKAMESVGKRANHLIHFWRGKEEFWKFIPVK